MTVTTDTAERERLAFAAVELARNPGRPRALQVIAGAFTEWTELRGERLFGDDAAIENALRPGDVTPGRRCSAAIRITSR